MHLINDSGPVEESASQGDLAKEMPDVSIDAVLLMRDDPVAAAIKAGTEAKRNMHVRGQGLSFARAAAHS
jgi:hypothetical protein